MNRFINMLLLVITFPTIILAVFVGLDLPIGFLKTSGNNLPFKFEIFLGIGLLLLIIQLRRSIRRWMGMRIVKQTKKFTWNAAVSKERKKRVNTYLSLEAMVYLVIGGGVYILCDASWMVAVGLLYGVVDNIVFGIFGKVSDGFRVGLTSKALILADREVNILYFTGLRKITAQQQSIYFDYIKDLQLSFPANCISEENKKEFYTILEKTVDKEKVFFSRKIGAQ